MHRNRPRILFVTSHWPLAPAYGAQQRVLNIARLMERFADVTWVIAPSEPENEETARNSKKEFDIRAVFRPIIDPRRTLKDRLQDRFRHEFDPSYIATDPYVASADARTRLCELIAEHDVVWVHTLRTAHWFQLAKWPHSVLDIDDLPSSAYRSGTRSESRPFKRLMYRRMAGIWQRRESALLDRFDVLAVCSEVDRSAMRSDERIHVIPNGSNPQPLLPRSQSAGPRIGFIGNCEHAPNEKGLRWFLQDVWNLVTREIPSAQLRLIGNGSQSFHTVPRPDMVGLGWQLDPGAEIATWSAMIVPINTGAGTRVKIADGFARKCPVVSTSYGAFGYEVTDGKEILIADEPAQFASSCISLIRDPARGNELADRAYAKFLRCWTWDSFQPRVESVIQDCLARSGGFGASNYDENVDERPA